MSLRPGGGKGEKRRTMIEGWPVVVKRPLRWGRPSGGETAFLD
jgi:hypothetical protein